MSTHTAFLFRYQTEEYRALINVNKGVLLNSSGIIRCPECRTEHQQPPGGFPTNITIARLLESTNQRNVPVWLPNIPTIVQPSAPSFTPPPMHRHAQVITDVCHLFCHQNITIKSKNIQYSLALLYLDLKMIFD